MTQENAEQMEERAAKQRRMKEEDDADMEAGYAVVTPRLGSSLETVVNKLHEMHSRGLRAFVRFNHCKFYSDTVTMDGAYLEATGQTKVERDAQIASYEKKIEESEAVHREAIPQLIEHYKNRSRAILDEKYWALWDDGLKASLEGMYKGYELGQTLNLIKCLKSYSVEEAEKMFYEQGHSGTSGHLTIYLVALFSEEGKAFEEKMLRPVSAEYQEKE